MSVTSKNGTQRHILHTLSYIRDIGNWNVKIRAGRIGSPAGEWLLFRPIHNSATLRLYLR